MEGRAWDSGIASWMIVNVRGKEIASYAGDAMDLFSVVQAMW